MPGPRLARLFALAVAVFLAATPAARADEVERDRLVEHVRYLASDDLEGRGTGTPGGEKAAAYIALRFEAAGCDRVERQPFDVVAGVALGPANALSFDLRGEKLEPKVREGFSPLGFSHVGRAAGEVVFAGYGLAHGGYDDFAGIDVKGKVVIILDKHPRPGDPHTPFAEAGIHVGLRFKAIRARELGAAALIVVASEKAARPEDDPALLGPMADTTHGDVGIPVLDLRRSVAAEAIARAGRSLDTLQDAIDRELAPHSLLLSGLTATVEVDLEKVKKETANVVATIEGKDEKLRAETIVVGAHYDHLGRGAAGSLAAPADRDEIHNGADDNASGTAALIELARALARPDARPRRTVVLIAFSAEEMGLLGATHYVKSPLRPLESTVAMLNMDMIGRMKGKKIVVGGAETAAEWAGVIDRAAHGLDLEIGRDPSGFGPSDHSAFYQRGVPVFFLFTGPHKDYHKPSDDADRIEADGLAKAARLALRLVREVDALEKRPEFRQSGTSPHARGDALPSRGPAVYLGSIPDAEAYAGESAVPGVLLGGVTPGSPAEAAGLKAGDRIVRFGGKAVRDIYDYTSALFSGKPGDRVKVVVVRDGAEVEVEAVLGRKGEPQPPRQPPPPQ